MENQNEESMPDFDRLNDRIINNPSPGPFIGIKTELDMKNQADTHPEKNRQLHSEVTERMDAYFISGDQE